MVKVKRKGNNLTYVSPKQFLEELLRARRPGETWEAMIRRLNRRDQFRQLLIGLVAVGALALSGGRVSPAQSHRLWQRVVEWLIAEPARRSRVQRALARYARDRTVVFTENEGVTIVQLTETGQRTLQRYAWQDLKIVRPAKWDGRWRIVLFDIPEERRVARDIFRQKLQELGFVYMQKSAWVHPFPCEHIIAAFRELYEMGPYVTILRADSIDGEERLRQKFGLS